MAVNLWARSLLGCAKSSASDSLTPPPHTLKAMVKLRPQTRLFVPVSKDAWMPREEDGLKSCRGSFGLIGPPHGAQQDRLPSQWRSAWRLSFLLNPNSQLYGLKTLMNKLTMRP